MSLNEEFDELARRKLEERQFPLQEADWQDARARIDAHRRGRGRAAWIIGAGLLLLIGSGGWYATRPVNDALGTAAVEQGKMDQPKAASTVSVSAIALKASDRTSASTASSIAKNQSATPANEPVEDNAKNIGDKASVGTNTHTAPREERASVRTATAPNASVLAAERPAHVAATTPARRQGAAPTNAAPSVAANRVEQPVSAGPQTKNQGGEVLGNDAHQDGGVALTSTDAPGDKAAAPSNTSGVREDGQPPLQKGSIHEPGSNLTAPPTDGKDLARSGGETPAEQNPKADQSTNTGTGADQPAAMGSSALGDSASAPPAEVAASGSANAAPPAPEAAPPIVPVQAPWEISVLGGGYNSKSDYSGSNSAEWKGDISTERSMSVGAEFMHMGRNIGLGAGIHYGSYAERLRSNAIDLTSTSTENYWYLLPVDTTFLFITDSLPGQPTTYTGTSVDTTVNILTPGTNTVTSTQRLREARDQVNRVSYLEVPVLLDAHLVQGRWSFGLRGGPTIGLLTATRGSVPSADNEGYVEFTHLPFREFMLGYTARAYIRYRFNAAWSVGIEPAIRGQLMNSLGSGDLTRRASSKGVLLSLSYRLR